MSARGTAGATRSGKGVSVREAGCGGAGMGRSGKAAGGGGVASAVAAGIPAEKPARARARLCACWAAGTGEAYIRLRWARVLMSRATLPMTAIRESCFLTSTSSDSTMRFCGVLRR